MSGGKERVEGRGFSQRVMQLGGGRVKGKTSVRGRANGLREGWSEGEEHNWSFEQGLTEQWVEGG